MKLITQIGEIETVAGKPLLEAWCDECGTEVATAVRLGQEPDEASATATVCLDCLRKAVAMAEGK